MAEWGRRFQLHQKFLCRFNNNYYYRELLYCMKFNQPKINKAEFGKFVLQTGQFIFRTPSVVLIGVMFASLVFIFVIWWQYIFRLGFSREVERADILLQEKDLTEAVKVIEQRKERFDGALKQEYRNLFR